MISKDDDVFLVIRTKRSEAGKVRRIIHGQDWYSGDDTVLKVAQKSDYLGCDVEQVTSELRGYWAEWKLRADIFREQKKE